MGQIIKLPSRSRPYLAAAGVFGLALVAAAAAAVAMDRITELAVPLAPVAAAVVVAAIFAWRCPEGIVAFGLFALLADTIEYWASIDLCCSTRSRSCCWR